MFNAPLKRCIFFTKIFFSLPALILRDNLLQKLQGKYVEKQLKFLFPKGKSYEQERWYNQLHLKRNLFRSLLLKAALLIGAICTALLMGLNFLLEKEPQLWIGFSVFTAFFLLYILSFTFQNPWFYRCVFLFSLVLVLACAFWAVLPLYLIIIVIIPLLSINILGQHEGIVIALLFPISQGIITFLLNQKGFLSKNPVFFIFMSFAFITILVFSLILYKQFDAHTSTILDNILFDRVTKLPMQKVLKNHCSHGHTSLFAIVKIVNFEELGLIFGYELSDTILIHVARFLENLGSSMGFSVYRLRGNEFGILKELESSEHSERASSFLLALFKRMENLVVNWNQSHLTLYMVLGGSLVEKDNHDYLSQADMAVKEAVERHVSVVLYTKESTVKDNVLNNLNHYSILRDNLDDESLEAYYQPIIDSSNNEVIWYETLLRIREKDGTMSSPIPYLSVAESTGLDKHISDFVLKEACKALGILNTHISVNVSLNDLKRPDFLENLIRYFPEKRSGEGTLILEILERQELHTLSHCQKFLKKAKELGCLIALDDFGSGYSNYSNLLEIPIDIVKIDGELVKQLEHNERAHVIIQNIIQFSKTLQLKVVAEYVEKEETAKLLHSMGVDFLQGWLFGKAQPISMHYVL